MGSTTNLRVLSETRALMDQHGSTEKVAEIMGVSRRAIRERLAQSADLKVKPLWGGTLHGKVKVEKKGLPKGRAIRRYIVTSAQNNTRIHDGFWENLEAYADHLGAEILISTFTYNHNAFGEQSVKRDTLKQNWVNSGKELWYDPRIEPFVADRRIELAPGLAWCGETNILPTKLHPLSGYETYTGRSSGIIPHAKVAMQSIASGKFEPTKLMYSTGALTLKNYIQKDAGLKGEFHHTFGALIVEVDSDGDWFVRQLSADDDGNFQDLWFAVTGGKVTRLKATEENPNIVLAVQPGDTHKAKLEDWMENLFWGRKGIKDQLRPAYEFQHDLFDMEARSHHDMSDPHLMYEKFIKGTDSVQNEIDDTAHFLAEKVYRPWCETVVVDSNHDEALEKWVREAGRWIDYDYTNVITYHELKLAKLKAIKAGDDDFHLLEYAITQVCDPKARFLREDESFVIAREHGGGIQCGNHGHRGNGGSRGSPVGLSKMGRKSNYGHIHAATIMLGAWFAGVMGSLDQGYNKGPSNWTHSFIVTYANGKRAMVTIWNGKPWAGYKQR